MEKFFANLKRFLAPRTRPPALAPVEPAADALAPTSESDTQASSPLPGPTPSLPHEGALLLTLATPAATFTVTKAGATLGRGQENTIRLEDLSISRRHARITYRQGSYWLSDLGSMGGTWIDGARLNAPHRIAAGQVIDIGLCRLTVSIAGGVARAETNESASRARPELAGQGRRRR